MKSTIYVFWCGNIRLVFYVVIFCLLGLSSCYYDAEESLYPDYGCNLINIRYNADIVPIVNKYCYSCHSVSGNQGNVIIEGYENIIKYVNDGSLMGSIKHESGWIAMPQSAPKIRDCDIMKIEEWILSGKLNN